MDMGEKIYRLRQERGMTLEQVGNLVGVGKSTVRKWENGMIANMRRDKIANLASALGTTPAYLMGWEEDPVPPVSTPETEKTPGVSAEGIAKINAILAELSPENQEKLLELARLYLDAQNKQEGKK